MSVLMSCRSMSVVEPCNDASWERVQVRGLGGARENLCNPWPGLVLVKLSIIMAWGSARENWRKSCGLGWCSRKLAKVEGLPLVLLKNQREVMVWRGACICRYRTIEARKDGIKFTSKQLERTAALLQVGTTPYFCLYMYASWAWTRVCTCSQFAHMYVHVCICICVRMRVYIFALTCSFVVCSIGWAIVLTCLFFAFSAC